MTVTPARMPLSPEAQRAYRMLLYHGMVHIRNLCQSRGRPYRNPFKIYRQYRASRLAGAIGDWLHNLAVASANGFEAFDEDQFWSEYEGLKALDSTFFSWPGIDFREWYRSTLLEPTKDTAAP